MFKKFALAAAALAVLAAPAFANNHRQDAVWDTRGDVVRSAVSGDCVYAANQYGKGAGCLAISLEERTVYFAFNSAKLDGKAKAKLDSLATYLKKSGVSIDKVTAVGYADRIGNVKYNDALSAKRAKAVTKYLVGRGIKQAKYTEVRALGEKAPTTECEGDKATKALIACLAPDRRVEVEVLVAR